MPERAGHIGWEAADPNRPPMLNSVWTICQNTNKPIREVGVWHYRNRRISLVADKAHNLAKRCSHFFHSFATPRHGKS
jgi:hypothetical protein